MTLMAFHGPTSQIKTALIPADAQVAPGLSKTTFEFEDEEGSIEALMDCDWDLILESLHIAFMQQEALRFEQLGSFPELTPSETGRGHKHANFKGDDDEFQDKKNRDQRDSHYSQYESSTVGGDIRVGDYSDDDDDEQK